MTTEVAIALGVLPFALLGAKVGMVFAMTARRIISWLLEEPEGMRGAVVRIVAVAALLRGMGVL